MNNEKHPRPRAFDLNGESDPPKAATNHATTLKPTAFDLQDVVLSSEELADIKEQPALASSRAGGFSWFKLLLSTLALLLSLAIGLAIDGLLRDLFARYAWLGWFGVAVTAMAVIAAIMMILHESIALARLRKIDSLRLGARQAYDQNDKIKAEAVARGMVALYQNRPDQAGGRALLSKYQHDIMDARGRLTLIERHLVAPLDERANALIMNAAKRVAIVTAISPRALIDIVYVLAENMRLIRAIAALYGGKPGMVGFLRLTRNVLAHLAITGAVSIGDGLVQQIVGHGLAAKLSARFGEGVVNGLLTARIGLAAHDVCRPLPFLTSKRPGISLYLNALIGLSGRKDT